MDGSLIVLYKHHGVQLVGVDEMWWRMMEKFILKFASLEVKEACRTEQLSGEMEVGVQGVIHMMHLLWKHHVQEKYWVLLIIEIHNAFN